MAADSYKEILALGGKTNSLGCASEVITSVYADPSRLDELFDCISADDAWVRMRAIDSFEKIIRDNPKWAQPYLNKIFNDLIHSEQPSVQWHLAQLFCEIHLTNAQRKSAIEWLKNRLETIGVDWIVSVNAMKALMHFYQNGFVQASELKRLFKIQEEHTSRSVRKKAASLYAAIHGVV